jgi:hypothetical protein
MIPFVRFTLNYQRFTGGNSEITSVLPVWSIMVYRVILRLGKSDEKRSDSFCEVYPELPKVYRW